MHHSWWVSEQELNDEQKVVVSLPPEGSHAVVGPPGSGKTNLLLLRANYIALAGHPNIQVVVFTRTLREFMATGAAQYAFPFGKVVTCRRWQDQLLYEYGIATDPPESFEEQRRYFLAKIQDLIEEKKLEHIYDAILLDEAQDYFPEEIEIFRTLARVLFIVADSRQKIYPGEDSLSAVRSAVDKIHRLRFHYRNGLAVCRLADALAKDSRDYEPLEGTCNYDEEARPSSVKSSSCGGPDDEADRIIEELSVQLKAYPGEFLGVATPRVQELEHIWQRIESSPLAGQAALLRRGQNTSIDASKPICVSTFHASKGLEYRALHLAGCEFLRRFRLQRNMAFTAVTRAKTSLSIYFSGELPGFFEGALEKQGPLPDLPKLKDVFGREK